MKKLYNDNLRKLPNEYGDVSVMAAYRPNDGPPGARQSMASARNTLQMLQICISAFVCHYVLETVT